MTPEGKIKTEIREYLTRNKIFWSSVRNGPGAKAGDPDLILCVDGRFVGVEVKTDTGRLSPLQHLRGEEIKKSGGLFLVVRSLSELIIQLKNLEPLK